LTSARTTDELGANSSLPRQETSHGQGPNDKRKSSSQSVNQEGDEDERDHEGPSRLDGVDEQRLVPGVSQSRVDGRG